MLKEKLFAHLETWRPYTVVWCGIVSLVGACVAYNDFPSMEKSVLVFLIPILGWIAGLYASDYIDKTLDKIEKPHRPLPSGRISSQEAMCSAFLFAGAGLVLSFYLGIVQVLMVFIVAGMVLTYAKISKSRGLLGNVNRGVLIVFTFLFGWFSVEMTWSPLLVLLSLSFFFHDVNSNLVGATRDVKGDKKGGYRTIPVKYGVKTSFIVSLMLSILWVSLFLITVKMFDFLMFPARFFTLFFVAVLILVLLYIFVFISGETLDRKKLLRAHEFLVIERIILASAFIFGIATSFSSAVILFVIAISVTVISQQVLRKRYEFLEET